ncbi:MAG: DNA repair protein RecO [Vicinamibacterales bacterium]|jgi:DNA repair protein RecO (recombination protein O)|nr:DNA repair protein RecO [Acidobacteriota bacterium]MDP6372993.1 DNA repair protein RecO [Vicinamibacterales bacterium]MDP6607856.1 DNA repair protein RecO [Vicinamibacterales bacterium]HAK56139.1 DNA repair protein RecO [Acidobacteriota bacterium]|tara:strand:- start:11577 stop:12323 length:747 start_codon:yes stop_codon:yes gene_type:complete
MPQFTSEALVLRTYRLGEADRIVVFLTSDRGKKRGVAKGARKTRSRFVGALEPLTHVQVSYYEREHRDLVRVNDVEMLRSPWSALDPDALTYVGYFAELIDEWAPEADPNERLYRLGASVIEAMVVGTPTERLARYFEYWLLRLQGVYPSVLACHGCGADLQDDGARLSARDALFLCPGCLGGSQGPALSPASIAFLREAARARPSSLGDLSWSVRVGRELEAAHHVLITTHLEKELKSMRVLKELRH